MGWYIIGLLTRGCGVSTALVSCAEHLVEVEVGTAP